MSQPKPAATGFDLAKARADLAQQMAWGADSFGIVIVLILLTIIVFAAAVTPAFQLFAVMLSGGTLLFVLHTAAAHRRSVRVARIVVVVAIVGTAAALVAGDEVGETTSRGVGLLLAIMAPIVILRRIIVSPTITIRLVLGALAIYLLFGLAYSYLFPLIGSLTNEPFFVQTSDPTPSDFLYFSYTTLATIGYGDYTAAQSLGRMVSVSEGLVGQLYLVSAVAVLVGNVGRQLRPIAEEILDDDDETAAATEATKTD
jgi:ion channel